jgi:hypothetical protein
MIVGLPGMLLALALLSFKEPERQRPSTSPKASDSYSLAVCAQMLRTNANFYSRIFLSAGTLAIVNLTFPAWFPTYLIRVHGLPAVNVGIQFGIVILSCGTTGLLLGPTFARWLAAAGYVDAPLRIGGLASIGIIVFAVAFPYAPGPGTALVAAGGLLFCASIPISAIGFATQTATPAQTRGMISALYTITTQLLGFGVGPILVGLTTDHVFGNPSSVGNALQLVCVCASLVTCVCLFSNLSHYRRLVSPMSQLHSET